MSDSKPPPASRMFDFLHLRRRRPPPTSDSKPPPGGDDDIDAIARALLDSVPDQEPEPEPEPPAACRAQISKPKAPGEGPAETGAAAPAPAPVQETLDAPPERRQAWRKARLSADRRARLYPTVAAQQGGEYCVACDMSPDDLRLAGRSPTLCIDHVDNDPSNNDRLNLQLLCRACNTRKNHPATAPAAPRPAGPELSINRRAEPAFRNWLVKEFLADPSRQYPMADLLDDAAEEVGVSQDTIGRYLGKACSRGAMFLRGRNEAGTEFVTVKPEYR